MSELKEIRAAVWREHLATLEVIDELVELETNGAHLEEGYSSLFEFLTKKLLYSESSAIRRIRAARVVRAYPKARTMLKARKVSLCTLSLIQRELKKNSSLLEKISGKSKREVEALLVTASASKPAPRKEVIRAVPKQAPPPIAKASFPQPDSGLEGLKSPQSAPSMENSCGFSQLPPPVEEEYRLSFTVSKEVYQEILKAKAVLSHKGGTVAVVVEEGVKALLREAKKKATPRTKTKSTATTSSSRYVPAELKRQVMARDNGCCSYRNQDGRRCNSDWQVEIDHIQPVAMGGKTDLGNLRLLCRNHNQHQARKLGLSRKSCP